MGQTAAILVKAKQTVDARHVRGEPKVPVLVNAFSDGETSER